MRVLIHIFVWLLTFYPICGQKNILDSTFNSIAKEGFSGVILYAKGGKIQTYKSIGFSNYEKSKKLKKHDIFELASLSKQFTAMIIMICEEKGLVDYNDQVDKYIDIPYKGITIRHLLHHISGLPDYQNIMDQHWDKTKVADNDNIIHYLNKYVMPISFPPGEKYEYSNTGYVILASIAEKATGQDFIKLCQDWIFKPLKMKNTDIRSNEKKSMEKSFAFGHMPDSLGNFVNANKFHSSDYTIWLGNRKGPGRVSSTAKDLLKWDQALYSEKLVSNNTLNKAFTSGKNNEGRDINYGFGWVVTKNQKGQDIIYHTGSNPGYATILIRIPDTKETFIMLNNNDHKSKDKLIEIFLK